MSVPMKSHLSPAWTISTASARNITSRLREMREGRREKEGRGKGGGEEGRRDGRRKGEGRGGGEEGRKGGRRENRNLKKKREEERKRGKGDRRYLKFSASVCTFLGCFLAAAPVVSPGYEPSGNQQIVMR